MTYRHMIPTLLVTLAVILGLIPMLSVILVFSWADAESATAIQRAARPVIANAIPS